MPSLPDPTDFEPTSEQIILSAVGNALASGLPPKVTLMAISQSFDPWEVDAAITAAIWLHDIQERHRHET